MMVVDFGSSLYEFIVGSDFLNSLLIVGLLFFLGVNIFFVEGVEVEFSELVSNGGRVDDFLLLDIEVEGEEEIDDEVFVKEMERDGVIDV